MLVLLVHVCIVANCSKYIAAIICNYSPLPPLLSPPPHLPPPSFFIIIEQFDVNVNINIIFTIFSMFTAA